MRDYFNWGHLDKVEQSDNRKLTIHIEKVRLWANQRLVKKIIIITIITKLLEEQSLNIDSRRLSSIDHLYQFRLKGPYVF